MMWSDCVAAGSTRAGGQARADGAVDAPEPAAGVAIKPGKARGLSQRRVGDRRGQQPGGGKLAEGEGGPVERVVAPPGGGSGDSLNLAVQGRLSVPGVVHNR